MKKITDAICLLIVVCFVFLSCASSTGLHIGFNKRMGQLPDVYFGVKSDTTEFDVDKVALEFSYGNGSVSEVGGYVGNYVEGAESTEDCPIVCVCVYFYNSKYGDALGEARFADYKEIEGLHFVKEISLDDYNENYGVENRFFGCRYEHTETFTVPQEAFELTTGYVCIGVYEIAYIPSQNLYRIADGGYQALKYEKLDSDTVKISQPVGSYYADPKA